MSTQDVGEQQDERILASLLEHKLQMSLKVIASAQALAWYDLPANEKRTYLEQAEAAYRKERQS